MTEAQWTDFDPMPALPFCRILERGVVSFWHVEPLGNDALDYDTGKQFAQAALNTGDPTLIHKCIAWMVCRPLGAIEAGFLSRISRVAMLGNKH